MRKPVPCTLPVFLDMPALPSLARVVLQRLGPNPQSACGLVSISTNPAVPTISIEPATSKIEEPFSLHLQGLAPDQDLTLQLALPSLAKSPSTFLSPLVALTADPQGRALLADTRAMVACMEAEVEPTRRYYTTGPFPGHLAYTATVDQGGRRCHGEVRRTVYGEEVQRVPLGEEGEVQGTLFLPEVPGPGVLCISGAAGVREDHAALLAGRGFTTLALGYFGMQGLPRYLHEKPLQ